MSSEGDQAWNSESEEENEEFFQTREGMQAKLIEIARKEENFEQKILFQKEEIIKNIGKKHFDEFYDFFKEKATGEGELTELEENAIEEFVYSKISVENTEVIFSMYKILHLEEELTKFRDEYCKIHNSLL